MGELNVCLDRYRMCTLEFGSLFLLIVLGVVWRSSNGINRQIEGTTVIPAELQSAGWYRICVERDNT